MVVIFRPCTAETGSTQERTAAPSRWTVHAPHWAIPHPNFTPEYPRRSRSTHNRGISSGASTSRRAPFTSSFMGISLAGGLAAESLLLERCRRPEGIVQIGCHGKRQANFPSRNPRWTLAGLIKTVNDVRYAAPTGRRRRPRRRRPHPGASRRGSG